MTAAKTKEGPLFEILAPAGNMDMLRAAVFSGANCVYVGVKGFNARRGAANFGGEELAEAVAFCHARNCGVYAALNTLVLPGEEEALRQSVLDIVHAGCDAVIVQDLAAANMVKSLAPQLLLHASTQMSVHSPAGVRQLAAMGFSRAILARELSLNEVEHIAKQSPIELEVFVHGALCVCVSGQCTMSAFLGGRSANRGACAGPCRLPFWANGPDGVPVTEHFDLSLKDLSILDELPRLQKMGVVSAKIEGRLRGPEYVATVVDAAQKILNQKKYDKDLLQNVFSRSGFTDAWAQGRPTRAMFGVRTGQDTDNARGALPQARALYRREMPRVGVEITLRLSPAGGHIHLTDGKHLLKQDIPGPLAPALQPQEEALRRALGKMGGTPFFLRELALEGESCFVPAPVLNALRRQMLQELLALRQAPPPATPPSRQKGIALPVKAVAAKLTLPPQNKKLLRGRFATAAQIPAGSGKYCAEYLLPLSEAAAVPAALRPLTWLQLPRVLFGSAEEKAKRQVQQAAEMGFLGFEVQNIAHFELCKGLPVSGGFGLNCTNTISADIFDTLGCSRLTLSPELSLRQMEKIAAGGPQLPLDALCYGHLPLMISRACPLRTEKGCGSCNGHTTLTDRKGQTFVVECQNKVRSIHNPVPLWMADRLHEMPVETATLYFTTEPPRQAAEILQAFADETPATGPFTRGLYSKGVETT